MKTLQVELGENGDRSYPIFIGQDLLTQSKLIEPYVDGTQVLIVSNETVAPLYLEKVKNSFSAYDVHTVILPDEAIESMLTNEIVNSIPAIREKMEGSLNPTVH